MIQHSFVPVDVGAREKQGEEKVDKGIEKLQAHVVCRPHAIVNESVGFVVPIELDKAVRKFWREAGCITRIAVLREGQN